MEDSESASLSPTSNLARRMAAMSITEALTKRRGGMLMTEGGMLMSMAVAGGGEGQPAAYTPRRSQVLSEASAGLLLDAGRRRQPSDAPGWQPARPRVCSTSAPAAELWRGAIPGESPSSFIALRSRGAEQTAVYEVSEASVWDQLADNASAAAVRILPDVQGIPDRPVVTMVLLLYLTPCNPFNLGDVDALRTAKAFLESMPNTAVAGAVVIPSRDAWVRDAGLPKCRQLPFALRASIVSQVVDFAGEGGWIVTDRCTEGCLRDEAGPVAPRVALYARRRLYHPWWDLSVAEVLAEDSAASAGAPRASPRERRVPAAWAPGGAGGAAGGAGGAEAVPRARAAPWRLVVEQRKQSLCDEMLARAVERSGEAHSADVLERLLGPAAAELLAAWRRGLPAWRRGEPGQLDLGARG